MLLQVVVCVAVAGAAVAQCPDKGRTKIDKAGISNETNRNCASFSITLFGFTFATPPQCRDSYVQRLDDEFACQGAPSTGLCCLNTGKARIKIFGPSNTCPQPPATMPTTVQEATNMVECREPVLIRNTFNTSAQEFTCATTPACTKKSKKQSGEPQHQEQAGAYIGWWGNPDSQLPAADPSLMAGWMAPIEDVHPSDLPAPMKELWATVPPISFAQGIVADVKLVNRLADGSYASFAFSLQGSAAADGRFSFTSTTAYEGPAGEVAELDVDVSYDHRALYVGSSGESFYGAYPQSMQGFLPFLLSSACEVMPILDWMKGPVWIPRVSSAQFSSDPAVLEVDGVVRQIVRVTEHYAGTSLLGSRTYDFDVQNGLPRILRTVSKDEVGNVLVERTFSDHRLVEAGHLRPFSMTTISYVPGTATVRKEEKLVITEARACAESDVAKWRRSSPVDKWFLFH